MTLYQCEQMIKLCDQLASRQASGEENITIKCVKGLPCIVKLDTVVTNSQKFQNSQVFMLITKNGSFDYIILFT